LGDDFQVINAILLFLRIQEKMKHEMGLWEMKLRGTEDLRKKTWRKLVELRAEYETPRRGRMDYNSLPPLHSSSYQQVPADRPAMTIGGHGPKYHAISRERIAADGSVAPASEARRGRDGLYARPAGRTRKGMNWDAVRGIWVPSTF